MEEKKVPSPLAVSTPLWLCLLVLLSPKHKLEPTASSFPCPASSFPKAGRGGGGPKKVPEYPCLAVAHGRAASPFVFPTSNR